jgi:leucine dehydrogenase
LINVAAELDGYNHERVLGKVSQVYNTIASILESSHAEGILPHQAADALAERKLAEAKKLSTESKLAATVAAR